MITSTLEIPGFSVNLLLGCEAWERANHQEVRVFIKIKFLEKNLSEETDELSDTICYGKLSEAVQDVAKKTEYKLIEKFVHEVYLELKKSIAFKVEIFVKAHKLRPPIDVLTNGVFYSIGDASL